jgi:unsaturated rhamnogalacturonyl hydrolase
MKILLATLALAGFTLAAAPRAQTHTPISDQQAAGSEPADPGPLATDLSPSLHPRAIHRAMRKVADWQLSVARSDFNQQWTSAALYDGLIALSSATHDPIYANAVTAAADSFHWKLLDTRFPHADDEALGQAYLDLYQLHPDPNRLASAQATMNRLAALPPDATHPLWWWCDALFMAPPVLAHLYAITGGRKYLDALDRNWAITSNLLYDPAEHLFFRDASFLHKKEANGQLLFWARGNGWVLAGLANVLQYMPTDYPSRARYVTQFRDMASRIAQLQNPDGLWKTGLLDPGAYTQSEVSGSAFYTFAIAWGINHHLLDRVRFEPVVARAWAGMVHHIYASGRLGSIQPIGAAPGAFTPSSSYVFGVGGFLLAGSELDRMATPSRKDRTRHHSLNQTSTTSGLRD